MFVYVIAGLVAGAIGGLLLLPKGACKDGSCPFTSGRFGGIFLGAIIGLALGMLAFSQFGNPKSGKTPASAPAEKAAGIATATAETENSKEILAHVGTDGFNAAISKGTVLVDFFATWCGPCKLQVPILEKFAGKYQGDLKVIKVNIDEAPEIAQKYGVTGVPALVFFHDGKLLGGMMGLQQDTQLEEAYSKVKEMITAPQEQSSPAAADAASTGSGHTMENDA